MLSGRVERRYVSPGCPLCPPGRLTEGRRRLLVRLANAGSVEGGREEL
jgi:hypothetical protein